MKIKPISPTPESPQRLRLRIRGQVQGVYYRGGTREQAWALGLRGWVRNEDDGCVSIVVEGSQEALEQLLAWCHQGPPEARVSAVEARWGPATGEFSVFEILRERPR